MLDEDPLISLDLWVDAHQACVLYYQRQELILCHADGCEHPASQGPVGGKHAKRRTLRLLADFRVLAFTF